MDAFFNVFRQWLDFKGRTGRAPYITFVLVNLAISIACLLLDVHVVSEAMDKGRVVYFYTTIYSLVIFIPFLALNVRRLHDLNYSGWFVLMFGVPLPYIRPVLTLLLMIMPGTPGPNRYGKPPTA